MSTHEIWRTSPPFLQLMFFLTPIIYRSHSSRWSGAVFPCARCGGEPTNANHETLRALLYRLAVPDSSQWLMMFGWTMAMLFVARVVCQASWADIGESV